MRTVLYDLVILALIAMAIGAYFVYRGFEARKVEDMNPTMLQSAAATWCQLTTGNFEGSSSGTMFLYKGSALFNVDIEGTASGFTGNIRVLLKFGSPLSVHIYPESRQYLPVGDERDMVNRLVATLYSFPWKCSPWWTPDSAAFVIPK